MSATEEQSGASALRVCLFGSYDRVAHPRIAILEAALREGGAEVVEAHVPAWPGGTDEKLAAARRPLSPGRLVRLAWTWSRLAARYRQVGPHDVVLIGYFGHLDVLLARVLARRKRRVLDMFLSVYDTVVLDRKTVDSASVQARLAKLLDRVAVRASDLALLDTAQQVDFVTRELGLPAGKLAGVPVGAEPWRFPPGPPPEGGPLKVLFYSSFIPLHGAETVARAIRQVDGEEVTVTVVGRGQDRAAFDQEVAGLDSVAVHDWVSYEHLGELVTGHHVVLGLFGVTGKASRVVPGKVYQAACAARAVVTADTPAMRAAFDPDEVVLVPRGDPDALATALRGLIKDRARVVELGHRARARFERDYTPAAIGPRLVQLLRSRDEPEWVRPPRFLLRLDLVRRLLPRLSKHEPVLEVGFGAGAMLEELAARGFGPVVGIDFSAPAARLATNRLARFPPESRPTILRATLDALDPAKARFHSILAFEVLEHVEDDRGLLAQAFGLLAPGGRMLASVPAHQHRFSVVDELVGHVRRYEREQLAARFAEAGFEVEELWCYGYPLANLLERMRRGLTRPPEPGTAEALRLRSAESGNLVPARGLVKLLVRPATMAPFLLAQRLFLGTDRGDGYLLRARKPPWP
jgi:glycosyltransferase involved in cell wall biosynthesis/protein-L-isoaspartate O-methyltransferase